MATLNQCPSINCKPLAISFPLVQLNGGGIPPVTLSKPQLLGQYYENQALEYLQSHGLSIIAKNYRCPLGEIDLICQDDDCLVFIEVRYRKAGWVSSLESITTAKQQRLIKAGLHYLQKFQLEEQLCRFDAIGIDGEKIDWLKNVLSIDT
jgi:putative endonuclease